MTAEWEPATEVEHALRAALQVGDEEGYFRVLSATELLVPLYADESGVAPDPATATARQWATWFHEERNHVLAYTSEQTMAVSFGGQAVPYHQLALTDIAAYWPDENWWLAVNPGLPIQGYLPAWFIDQLGHGGVPEAPAEPEPEPVPVPSPAIPEQRVERQPVAPPQRPDPPAPSQPGGPGGGGPAYPPAPVKETAPPDPAPAQGVTPVDEFTATNEVEKSLLAAARAGNTDAFLRAMLVANVLVPLADDMPDGATVGSPDFRWQVTPAGGRDSIVLFTSPERMSAQLGAGVRAVRATLVQAIRAWPPGDLPLALNPGTPIGASLPGEQVLSLAQWAGEMGLADDASPPEVMQKVIPHHQLSYYLERGYNRVAGFVYRARDVAGYDTPASLYAALGLTGHTPTVDGLPFAADDQAVAVLRWPAYRTGLYRTPYGGRDEAAMRDAGGWVIEEAPFRGAGYAPNDTDAVIPEYKVDSVSLPHGSEIYRVGRDGGEVLYASYDADGGRWLPAAEGSPEPPPHPHDPSSSHDGYLARWRGRDCDASPDGEQVRLYAAEPLPGFADLGAGRHVRIVPHGEVDDLWYRRTTCQWRGAPFTVLGTHGQWLRVEYTGGQALLAAQLGLERYDLGVYQGWVAGSEVTDLREERI